MNADVELCPRCGCPVQPCYAGEAAELLPGMPEHYKWVHPGIEVGQ